MVAPSRSSRRSDDRPEDDRRGAGLRRACRRDGGARICVPAALATRRATGTCPGGSAGYRAACCPGTSAVRCAAAGDHAAARSCQPDRRALASQVSRTARLLAAEQHRIDVPQRRGEGRLVPGAVHADGSPSSGYSVTWSPGPGGTVAGGVARWCRAAAERVEAAPHPAGQQQPLTTTVPQRAPGPMCRHPGRLARGRPVRWSARRRTPGPA